MINNNSHQLKLIDFGLADGTRVKRASMLIGNVRFSSRGAHFGVSSQKDDLESLIYVLYHLLAGELPWENATKTDIELEINRKSDQGREVNSPILMKKYAFLETLKFPWTKNEIKKVVYSEYSQLMKYIIELEVDGEPDY